MYPDNKQNFCIDIEQILKNILAIKRGEFLVLNDRNAPSMSSSHRRAIFQLLLRKLY